MTKALIAIAFFILWWPLLFYLVSFITGWRKLASHYAERRPFRGEIWKGQTVGFRRFSRYKNILRVGASGKA